MNIIEVIKDCIANPCFVKDYDLEECTISGPSQAETKSITKDSCFTGFSGKRSNILSGGPGVEDSKMSPMDRKLMQLYMRVWAGIGKLIVKELGRGNCFVTLDIGYFFPTKGQVTSPGAARYCFSPTLELLDKYQFQLLEDEYNVTPTNRSV